jgi:hypothetical protein
MVNHRFTSNGKRDIHKLEFEYDKSYSRLETIERWKYDCNREIVLDYLRACKRGQAKSGGRNIRVRAPTLYRVLGILRLLSEEWLQSNFDKATKEDWQTFYDKMEDNIIRNESKSIYKQSSKARVYKTI